MLTKSSHAMSSEWLGVLLLDSQHDTDQPCHVIEIPQEPHLRHLHRNLAFLESPCQDQTQGMLTSVLRTTGPGEAGDGLQLQGSPLCRMSGTCFPSKASVCKAFSSG